MRALITAEHKTIRVIFALVMVVLAPSVVHAQGINLAWDPSASTGVAGYTVHVGVNPGVYGQSFEAGTNTTFTFNTAAPGTRYYFAVTAYDAQNNSSAYSNEVSWKINVGPRLTEPASVTNRVGVAATLQLNATDDGDPLTYTATGLPAGLTLNSSTGRITGTPTTVGPRSVSVTVSDGQLTATHSFTWTIAAPPSADSVSPATGNGATQSFELDYSDPLGATATSRVWVWFNATFASSSANSCMTYYDRPAARVYLLNDAGTVWTPGTLGSSTTLQNSQCSIAMNTSSLTSSGNSTTLTLAMTFRTAFAGAKNIYMYAADATSNSGWQTRGSWTVPTGGGTTPAVTADSVSPASGNGATQSFTLQYSNTQGATNLATTWVWFNASFASSSANSCMAYYDRPASRLYLLNDAGTVWTPGTLGSSGTLQNSQCSIALGSSSAPISGNTLTLNLNVTFRSAFSGAKNVYMYGASSALNSGWQTRGSWTVPTGGGGGTTTVSADSVSPNTGNGTSQAFALQYSDSRGATQLTTAWAWFNATFASSSANSCMVYYDRPAARLYLLNDAGTTWNPGTLGSSGSLQNSQCSIALASSSAPTSGNTLTLNLNVTFRSAFSGTKNVYMYAASGALNSGWQTRGSWTVPTGSGSGGVTADSVTPNAGAGMTQTFALQYSHSSGATSIQTLWVWFNATFAPTATNTCMVYYDRATTRVYLINNTGTAWTSGTLGSAGTIQNSQCFINLGGSSVVQSGNTATLNLSVTFRSAFTGAKNIYMYAAGNGGTNSGWQTRGTWTAQ